MQCMTLNGCELNMKNKKIKRIPMLTLHYNNYKNLL